MPAIASMVLPDAQATPVNHTFEPDSIEGGLASWLDSDGAVSTANKSIKAKLKRSTSANGPQRVTISYAVPFAVTETINGVPVTKVVEVDRCNIEFILGATSSLQRRKDLRAFVSGSLGHSQLKTLIEDQKALY